MPRKQRFKPSRKPKVVGTPTDLVTTTSLEATRPPQTEPENDGRVRVNPDAFPPAVDLGGESG